MATIQNASQAAPTTTDSLQTGLRSQLQDRRQRLERIAERTSNDQIQRLLEEVDAALLRLEEGSLGICEVCHDAIEPERFMADPLTRFCIGHLPPEQQRALEADLELAAELQVKLLPDKSFPVDGWHVSYEYRPLGMVSGDYCDLLRCPQSGTLYFALGDVSGKGVAACMLMANLSAMFRALVPLAVSLPELMAHVNRVFCQSTLPNQYATLILGKATPAGEVEICNAGHLEPLLFTKDSVTSLNGASTPIGLFRQQTFTSCIAQLAPGDTLVLYSDGIPEASNGRNEEYGSARLAEAFARHASLGPSNAIAAFMNELAAFQGGARPRDDQALMLLRRAADLA